ncbi:regulation of nuclear pre-mRNA domain-containing protein 1A isoform X2 [Anabrus simplex]|uniref:regulation of nuclear pre-mRNA domain-containing protein 1A isoform X2 n=1 Tax=Anabrus simplex TaxID=316456 RepID=UPI0034DD1FDE
MSTFSEEVLLKKFGELNTAQHSIQTLSLWLIHHRKHRAVVVAAWFRELIRAENNRKLVFMYLANDVIQTSRKKGPEYCHEFDKVLEEAFESLTLEEYDDKTRKNIQRILQIWEEREVYNVERINAFQRALAKDPATAQRRARLSMEGAKENLGPQAEEVKKTVPNVGELSGLLQVLKNASSLDSDTRSRIDQLTCDLSSYAETNLLHGLGGAERAQELDSKLERLLPLIVEYNGRLSAEMSTRRKMVGVLENLASIHQAKIDDTKAKIAECSRKLEKIKAVKHGIKSRVKYLPSSHRYTEDNSKYSLRKRKAGLYRPY